MKHLYNKEEAQRILDAFPTDKLEELVGIAVAAKSDPKSIDFAKRIPMPEGWEYRIFGNCIIAAYCDGEQERKTFFVPRIWIDFLYVDDVTVKKSIEERLALGYCSCGKRMPFAQALLWASDRIEKKGFLSLPSKAIGYTVGFFLSIYLNLSAKQQMSLQFNRHWSCL